MQLLPVCFCLLYEAWFHSGLRLALVCKLNVTLTHWERLVLGRTDTAVKVLDIKHIFYS